MDELIFASFDDENKDKKEIISYTTIVKKECRNSYNTKLTMKIIWKILLTTN